MQHMQRDKLNLPKSFALEAKEKREAMEQEMKARADDLLEGLAERKAAMQRAKEAAENDINERERF